jgi:hypothetical protein
MFEHANTEQHYLDEEYEAEAPTPLHDIDD